tara:strand:+ start:14790 stop:16274 length:1485 start_codon:yes stop_codon:yes gene_type:complete
MIDINSQMIYLLTGYMPTLDKENKLKPLTPDEWTVVAKKLYSKNLMPKDLQSKNQDFLINELELDKDFSERIVKLLNRSGQFLFELEKYNTQGYKLLTRIDSIYPKLFKKNMQGSAPSYFWYIGNNSILKDSFISLQYKHNKKNDYSFIEKDLFPEIKKNKFSIVLSFNDDLSTELAKAAINNDIQVLGFPPTGLLKLTKQVEIRKLLKTKKLLLLSQSYPSIIKYYQYTGKLQKKSELSISEVNIIVDSLVPMQYEELNNISNNKIAVHFAVKSKKLDSYRRFLVSNEIFDNKNTTKTADKKDHIVYTIGHSNYKIEKFIELLIINEIDIVYDVRTSPKSSYVPHFNKMNLINHLKKKNIKYEHAKSLGGRPDKDDLLIKIRKTKVKKIKEEVYNGVIREIDNSEYEYKINENKIEKEEWYMNKINDLIEKSKTQNIALMCSEENPSNCHRGYIISHTLIKKNINVQHIRKNGQTEKAEKIIKSFNQATLFDN